VQGVQVVVLLDKIALNTQEVLVLQGKDLQEAITLQLQITVAVEVVAQVLLVATEFRRYLAQVVQVLLVLFLVQP
jgi:hypothetical protein